MTVTIAMKMAELQREIATRERVYPRWVEQGRMTQRQANERLAAMKAILADYRAPPRQQADLFGHGEGSQ